jgi:adenylate cyclase class 2
MNIEYEATFPNINKDKVRGRLKEAKAELVKPEFLQKRFTYNFPDGHEVKGGWLRVRNEGNKITLTLKIIDGDKIEDQKEVNLEVDDFEQAKLLLTSIGCRNKSYQETKRELWILDGVEIAIDEWPFLDPLVEVEGKSEEEVRSVSEKLGFNYDNALFCCITKLYKDKYNVSEDIINNKTPDITFKGRNPFI